MEDKRECRNTGFKITAPDEDKRTVEGYALLFDTPSDGLDFEEVIERGALDGVIEASDVFALLNHSMSRGILGRCTNGSGSLSLIVDNKGLKYRFEAPKTTLGDEILEGIRRGEIYQSSFSFSVKEDKWAKKENGTWKRNIIKIERLYDVSPVYNAAYSKTSVYTRGREAAEREMLKGYYESFERQLNI